MYRLQTKMQLKISSPIEVYNLTWCKGHKRAKKEEGQKDTDALKHDPECPDFLHISS